jgi:methionyl aminopeptidase
MLHTRALLKRTIVKDPAAVLASAAAAKSNGNGANAEAEDSDEEEDEKVAAGGGADAAAKKKRKRKKKPKSKTGGANPTKQTSPPRVLLSNLFSNNQYPIGEEVEYRDENTYRTTNEEKRALDRMNNDFLEEYRYGAEVHRQVRKWAHEFIQPGKTLTEIAEGIEDSVRALTGHPGLEEGDNIKGGVAFPTGVNLDHIAAHYSPNAGNKTVLSKDNVMKVDYGVHINGRIVDSAFTVAFDPMYDNLLTAVKEATNTGIKEAGIDARLGEIGEKIQETMESYEVEIRGETFPVKCIRNLNGHDIRQYQIHGGKSVPIVKSNDQTKMEEGEVFAIETFGSTGNGYVRDDVSIYDS